MNQRTGTVIHFFDKIGVAIIRLEGPLSVGERVRFTRGGEDLFDQTIESMQREHESVEEGVEGDEVGIKIDQKIKEGAEIFKLE